MEANKVELVKNFWRLGRDEKECASILALSLEEVRKIYEQQNVHRETLMRTITRLRGTVVLLLSLLACGSLRAQTISPVISEAQIKKSYTSNFTVTNSGVTPLVAVVEIRGLKLAPLSPNVHVELSQMSAKIGAKQSYNFWYRITCDVTPCVVTFNVALSGVHTDTGIAIVIHIPSSVYLCQKAKGCRASILGGRT